VSKITRNMTNFKGKSVAVQNGSKGKPTEVKKSTKIGTSIFFAIARTLAARRRAQKSIERSKTVPSKMTTKVPAKSPLPELLTLPVSARKTRAPSSTDPNSEAKNESNRSPQSYRVRLNRIIKPGKTYRAQDSPASLSTTEQVQCRRDIRSNSSKIDKIDRDAFRLQRSGDVKSAYSWNEDKDELGRGGCGIVFSARARDNPAKQVAVKRVLTNSVKELELLQEEIKVLRKLDHPNVLRLYESFEDGKTVYLVMELCKGGDLFERVSEREYCTEQYSSEVATQICGALAHCHDLGICHRDLKPENLLLLSQADDAPIKVADFGLAKHFPQESSSRKSLVEVCKDRRRTVRRLKTFAGTLEYMAPEIIRIKDEKRGAGAYYDFRCDTWAFGVIMYMMLTGYWPFKLEHVAAYVAEDVPLPDFDSEMSSLSSQAQDFIRICLQADFTKRPHPADLLKHPFLDTKQLIMPRNITPMAKRFSHFANLSGVKKAAFTAAVRHLKGFEVEELRSHFDMFDVNRDGTVTLQEFKKAVEKWPKLVSKDFKSAEELFQALDSDGSGQISFTEFLAAAMDVKLDAREDLARGAFAAFDQSGVGEITSEDIQRVMGGRRQGTQDLAEIGITKGEGTNFKRFREHLQSPSAQSKQGKQL